MVSRADMLRNSDIDALVTHLLSLPPKARMARLRQVEQEWRAAGKQTFNMMGLTNRVGERMLATLPRQTPTATAGAVVQLREE